MPGILPMKVIKVGTAAQSRIAQACDRCRSKKIRCDGITPCCTQCANVGFECKTSDKLSRRAFPRGYTESLEERVRSLEGEVKELKDLLDEKDEKIDILSKIHSNSPSLRRPSSTLSTASSASELEKKPSLSTEDIFQVQQSSNLDGDKDEDSFFMGASTGWHFIDTFRAKVQESGKPCDNIETECFFAVKEELNSPPEKKTTAPTTVVPPRMVSDQLINVFFQEWAPLFPVLHRPTFLDIYEEYVADPEGVKDHHAIAQLYLIFGISALSADWNKHDASAFETQWQAAIESIKEDDTLQTLQCLLLAEIHSIAKGEYKKLEYYRRIATPLANRLELHQSQKRCSVGALACETGKKVFWTLYTLDCFSAAMLGLPTMLTEAEIHTEYPADVDDENISDNGFQPILPGEFTRLSSALALFRVSRIMSKVLSVIYPVASSHDVSLQKLDGLDNELDEWLKSLPTHLRLRFAQDKPSTNVCGSRSPILSLVYHYIRTLIHRPAVVPSLGHKADPSVVVLAQSSKHIVQIVQLLEERRMSFSICLNKDNVLLLAGFGLLYQTLGLDRKGKLIQDSQRLLCSVTSILERNGAVGASQFKKATCAMISIDRSPKTGPGLEAKGPRRKSDGTMNAPKSTAKASRKPSTVTSSPPTKHKASSGRRTTAAPLLPAAWPPLTHNTRPQNFPSLLPDSKPRYCKPRPKIAVDNTIEIPDSSLPNLDYLDFSHDRDAVLESTTNIIPKMLVEKSPTNDTFPPSDMCSSGISPSSTLDVDWGSDLWTIPLDTQNPLSGSVLSFSEEEITSGEEMSSCDTNGAYSGIKIPQETPPVGLDDLDGQFAF